jgi:surface antigen
MRVVRLSIPLMAVAILAGCSNGQGGVDNQGTGLVLGSIAGGLVGNQFGKGGGNVAATVAGAVVGGVVGSEIGKSLDERDRRYAQDAEYDALERGQSGVSRQWRDPDTGHYGEVVPSRPYKREARLAAIPMGVGRASADPVRRAGAAAHMTVNSYPRQMS